MNWKQKVPIPSLFLKNAFIIFVISLGLCKVTCAGDLPVITIYNLQDCISTALKNNPLLLSARAEKGSSIAALDYQTALFRPALNFTLGSGYALGKSTSVFALGQPTDEERVQVRDISKTYYLSGIEFSYPVFKEGVFFGMKAPSIKKAEAQLGVAAGSEEVMQDEVVYKVIETYLNILKVKEEIKVQEENMRYLQSNYDLTASKYILSLIQRDELLKIESELAKAKAELENTKWSLIQEKRNLAYWMGIDLMGGFEIEDSMDDTLYHTSIPLIPLSYLDGLIESAHEKNRRIRSQIDKVRTAEQEMRLSGMTGYPSASLTSSLKVSDDYTPPAQALFDVFIEMQIPLLDFGRTRSATEALRYKFIEENLILHDMKNSVDRDITQAVTDIKGLENLMAAEEKDIEFAQESLDRIQENYKLDLVPLSSVLSAQYYLLSARHALVRSTHDRRLIYINLKRLIGELSPADIQQLK